MIIYELQCAKGHTFEGWFPGISACDSQVSQQMVHCAICGSDDVRRIPASGYFCDPEIRRERPRTRLEELSAQTIYPPTPKATGVLPETVSNLDPVIMVKAMHQFVRAHARDVGDQFADLMLKMLAGEVPSEPITGTATPEQRELLEEAGVHYASIPGIPEELDQ